MSAPSSAIHRAAAMLRLWTIPHPRVLPIAVTAAGIWLLTSFPGVWTGAGTWIVRGACVAVWAWLAVVFFTTTAKRPALATPLFLIVTLAFWLYAIIPIVFAVAMPPRDFFIFSTVPGLFLRLPGSEGELAVLRFSLLGISASAWALPGNSYRANDRGGVAGLPPRWIVVGLGIAAGAVCVLHRYVPADWAGLALVEFSRQAGVAALVIYSTTLALAALRTVTRQEGAITDLAILSLAAVGLILVGKVKPVIFILGIAGAAVALAWRSALIFAGVVTVSLVMLVLGIMVRQHQVSPLFEMVNRAHLSEITVPASRFSGEVLDVLKREGSIRDFAVVEIRPGINEIRIELEYHEGDPVIRYAGIVLAAKLVSRQAETVDCLTGVVRKHFAVHAESSNPFYFASGLVPRVLWPDKPNLSQSGKTVIPYCHADFAPNLHTDHSASGTLLWEPLAFAGIRGQIAAQALTFLMLIGLSRVWINGGAYAAAGVLALTPWTIDFDQHFALYIANLAKAGLVTGASLFLLAGAGRILRWR